MGDAAPKLIQAVGDFAYSEGQPPTDLIRAFDYKAYGVNVLDLPPGEVRRVTAAFNLYQSIKGYRNAAAKNKTAEWSKQNPDAYDTFTRYWSERIERKRKNG